MIKSRIHCLIAISVRVQFLSSALSRSPVRKSRFGKKVSLQLLFSTTSAENSTLRRPEDMVGTVRMLNPEWWHLSLCFGAVLQCSPFKSNFLRLADSIRETVKIRATTNDPNQHKRSPLDGPCLLMKCIFFQAHSGAPIRLTRNKSMAAAYFTPEIMGSLLGFSMLQDSKWNENEFRRTLREKYGIKSNYVNGEWTGVSLARWKELVFHLRSIRDLCFKNKKASSEGQELDIIEGLLTTAVWSMAAWNCCHTKQCVLDYFCAAQNISGCQFLSAANPVAGGNPGMLPEEDIRSSLTRFLACVSNDKGYLKDSYTSLTKAEAMEDLCSSILTRQHHANAKPTTPNGYYGFDGGKVKPDCVEVAIRELIDYLLWDDRECQFDVSRLPASAAPELVVFYKTHSALQGGEEWFAIMSDIPGCLYLSTSPNGRRYELTPTLRNVARVCFRLLYNNTNLSLPGPGHTDWESLSGLQEQWQHGDIQIMVKNTLERPKMSTDIHIHEVATIKMKGSINAIEIRLRCDWARNTGYATVTHLRLLNEMEIRDKMLDQLLSLTTINQKANAASKANCLFVLPLLADYGVVKNSSCRTLTQLLSVLLACRYGLDRREILPIAATSDYEREEAAFRNAQRDSEKVLLKAITKVCEFASSAHSSHQRTVEHLLNWILIESPHLNISSNVRVASRISADVENAILSLPAAAEIGEYTKQCIKRNWAIRGPILCTILDLKAGKTSFWDALANLKLTDWPIFLLNVSRRNLR